MQSRKRQSEILDLVRSRSPCSISELAELLHVSGETIRRAIKPLVKQGFVERIHGGIVLIEEPEEEPPFLRRMQRHVEQKRQISELVAGIVQDGDSIMMDTGSTTAFVARALRCRNNLSVVTNCTEIARTLARESGNRVHITGGELRADDSAAFGPSTIAFARQFQARYAILSIGAITENGDFTDYHLEEAEFSRTVIEQSQTTIVVADSSKFGSRAFVKICEPDKINILVSNQRPPENLCRHFADSGIRLVTPHPSTLHPV